MMGDLHIHFHVSSDTKNMETRMSDLETNFGELRDLVATESAQSAQREAKLTELANRVDDLTRLINEGTFPKEQVLTFFAELKAAIPGIVPDSPVIEPETPAEPPAE